MSRKHDLTHQDWASIGNDLSACQMLLEKVAFKIMKTTGVQHCDRLLTLRDRIDSEKLKLESVVENQGVNYSVLWPKGSKKPS